MSLPKHRPDSLRIMGRNFDIFYEDDLEGVFGTCHRSECEIEIAEGQHSIEEADTILHEALHAIFYLLNLNRDMSLKKEEAIVRPLATGLIQMFLDNPQFLKYLTKVVNLQRSV